MGKSTVYSLCIVYTVDVSSGDDCYSLLLKNGPLKTIEVGSFSIQHGDVPYVSVCLPEGMLFVPPIDVICQYQVLNVMLKVVLKVVLSWILFGDFSNVFHELWMSFFNTYP